MNYDQRKAKAKSLVLDFLSVLSPPRGLDEDQLATRIIQISDAFARRMPTDGDYDQSVAKVLTRLMDTHQSNTWPPQAAFVMAMPHREVREFSSQETFAPKDTDELLSDQMERGESIPETALWGQMASKLPHRHLDRYRNASVANWLKTYGHKAADAMFAKYGATVLPYLPQQATGVTK